MERREWLQLLAALAATPAGSAQQPPAVSVPTINKEMLTAALKVMGLEFSDAQLEMMLANVNRALGTFGALRKIEVPQETAPAFTFQPNVPVVPRGAKAQFRPSKLTARRDWKNIEDL
ncbi:MAG: hypothetical protein JNL62_13205, partial [Bryobacterales bacterium]|nr:hypothetical protein [Bryobacterales bacterium]